MIPVTPTTPRWWRWGRPAALTLLPVAIVTVIAILAWQRGLRNPVSPTTVSPSNPRIELRLLQVELRGHQQGKKAWAIWAPEVEVSRDQSTVFLHGQPHGAFYNIRDWSPGSSPSPTPPLPVPLTIPPAPPRPPVTVSPPLPPPRPTSDVRRPTSPRLHTIEWRSREGQYTFPDPGSIEQLILRGDVTIRTDDGDTVTSREVQWLPQENRIICPTHTRLRAHEGTRIEADRVVTNTELEVLEMFGKIRFSVPVKGRQQL